MTFAEIVKLSVPERILLVEEIWDSIADEPDALQLTDEQKAELDRRLEAHRASPGDAQPWSSVRERLRKRG
jgi:putative addiction module component (TIGR02574 family)